MATVHIDSLKQPLGRLPVEILGLILSALDDIRSLGCAVRSCRTLNAAFLADANGIATRVLLDQVGDDVLPEAIAAFESSRLELQAADAEERAAAFMAEHLNTRRDTSTSRFWSPAAAGAFARLHDCVRRVAQNFASDCLAAIPSSVPSKHGHAPASVTRAEMARITRALYCFETFCNIARRARPRQKVPEARLDAFCRCFAAWENEQLACVLEYLFRAVSPGFNEIAEHDVAWGSFQVEKAASSASVTLQGVFSSGLEMLSSFAAASSYSQRRAILAGHHPPVRPDFLVGTLERLAAMDRDRGDEGTPSSHVDRSAVQPGDDIPFYDDPDSGPADAWRWADPRDAAPDGFYRRGERRWGYVMWDRDRLDRSPVMHSQWLDVPAPSPAPSNEEAEERIVASWSRRDQIYADGGHRWWDFEDESKVVYPPPRPKNARRSGPKRRPWRRSLPW